MITRRLWWNKEMLPNEKERQKLLFLQLPEFYAWGFSCPIKIGYKKVDGKNFNLGGFIDINLIILGFGFTYTEIWD